MDTQSPSIAELAKALVKAQGEFQAIVKDKTAKVGQYSYNYADLASVLGAVVPVLCKNGLALSQITRWDSDKLVMSLDTRLLHTSGEWISGTYPLPTAAKPQEMGSAITYARRYSVTAILGIATEDDDDGQAAQDAGIRHASAKPTKRESKPEPEATTVITGAQAGELRGIIAEAGISNSDVGAEIRRICGAGVSKLSEIPAPKFAEVKAALEKAKAA